MSSQVFCELIFFGGIKKNVKGYKRLNCKENLRLKRYYNSIHEAACFFDTYFIGQNVVYYTNSFHLEVKARKSNFMHLCGMKYDIAIF